MRILVLGDFTVANDTPLRGRKVRSIMPGMQLKSFMAELGVTAPIEPEKLRQQVQGRLTGQLTARFKRRSDKAADAADMVVTGTATVTGQRKHNGLGDFEGTVTISGKIKVAWGDGGVPAFPGSAELRVAGSVRGEIDRGGIAATIDGPCSLVLGAVRSTGDELEFLTDVSGDVTVNVAIPLFEPGHFKPGHIAASVPEIRRLVILQRVLLELRGYLAGQTELRDALKELLKSRAADLAALQQYLRARYRQLHIDPAVLPAALAPPVLSDNLRALLESLLAASGMSAGDWTQRAVVKGSDESDGPPTASTAAAAVHAATDAALAATAASTAATSAAASLAPADQAKAKALATAAAQAAADATTAAAAAMVAATDAMEAETVSITADDVVRTAPSYANKVTASTMAVKAAGAIMAATRAAAEATSRAALATQAATRAIAAALLPVPPAPLVHLQFRDHEEDFPYADRFVNALGAFLANIDLIQVTDIRRAMQEIDRLSVHLDTTIQEQIQQVLHSRSVQRLEASWRSLQDLCAEVTSNEVIVDFLDVDKATLGQDLQDHSAYILMSELFHKVYVEEYDRYGGRPFGVMIGLYEFDSSEEDLEWLETMSHVAAAAHCPFVAAIRPQFFGGASWSELERKDDLETLLGMPQFGRWAAFRTSDHAAYIGLTLPRYMLRAPYDQSNAKSKFVSFEEKIVNPETDYLWGNAAVLFARNMVRSFEQSGWCQHVVGPRGGGLVRGLPVHMVMHHEHVEPQPPVEVAIPDYRELQFANTGFIALVHCKGTADAAFFSARSIKKPIELEGDLEIRNADLVCSLDYTLSITRIAHYIKRMVRDYIGSTADAPYIQEMLEKWLVEYVTTAVDPDDLTLRYYPFKAMSVAVVPKPGPFGWYNCTVSVLPHIKFQGMDVELRLEAALGGGAVT